MITSTDGQSPYNALIAAATTGRQNIQSTALPTELALAVPEDTESAEGEFHLFGEDGLSFADLVDVVNPLQHIPVVSTMYREASEDTIDPGSRMLGSTLFFGPIGLASSIVNVLIEQGTGKDIGAHIASAVFPDDNTHDEMEIADIAAFSPAASDAPGKDALSGLEQIDPVSAWAAGEAAWAREQQGLKRETPNLAERQASQSIPDADSFLNASYDQLAVINPVHTMQAARNASWAYESASDLAFGRS